MPAKTKKAKRNSGFDTGEKKHAVEVPPKGISYADWKAQKAEEKSHALFALATLH